MEESGPPAKAPKIAENSSPRSPAAEGSAVTNISAPIKPPTADISPSDAMSITAPAAPVEVGSEEEKMRAAIVKSRSNFGSDTFGKVHFPDQVLKALNVDRDSEIIQYLIRPSAQFTRRHRFNFGFQSEKIEYDGLHFNIPACEAAPQGYDEYHFRMPVQHDIMFAVYKLNIIKRHLDRAGYTIELSVPEAQLIILLDYLMRSDYGHVDSWSYTVHHKPSDRHPAREPTDENGIPYSEYQPMVPEGARPLMHYQYWKPYYIREVQNPSIVKALEGLRLKCFQFVVRDESERQYAAYAFLMEKVVKVTGEDKREREKLDVDVEMRYYALPSDEFDED